MKKLFTPRGFTLTELVVTMTIVSVLLGLMTINLINAQRTSSLSATLETFITDLRQQQLKAMIGDTEGRITTDNYGIHFESTSYTLYHGTYSSVDTTNFLISIPTTMQITSNFPNSQILFLKGSGEVSGFTAGLNTITLQDAANGQQKTVTINRYGVITGVN